MHLFEYFSLMHEVYNNGIPSNIFYLFTPTQDIHRYNTRSSSFGVFILTILSLLHSRF